REKDSPVAEETGARGWRIIQAATGAALLLELLDGVALILESQPDLRLAAALVTAGLLLLLGVIAYGVWRRARWAAWVGGALSGLAVLLLSTSLLAPLL